VLITVCTDDDELVRAAQRQSQLSPHIYGNCYQGFVDAVPQLGVTENLFVTSHGAFDWDGIVPPQPVIGDETHDLYLTAADLYDNLPGVFPNGYQGSVYISACESGDPGGPAALSFAQLFVIALDAAGRQGIAVYGHQGEVGLRTPPPGDPNWVRA
jgi:hypothetical protein